VGLDAAGAKAEADPARAAARAAIFIMVGGLMVEWMGEMGGRYTRREVDGKRRRRVGVTLLLLRFSNIEDSRLNWDLWSRIVNPTRFQWLRHHRVCSPNKRCPSPPSVEVPPPSPRYWAGRDCVVFHLDLDTD